MVKSVAFITLPIVVLFHINIIFTINTPIFKDNVVVELEKLNMH
jgi:hypothetical protein